MIDLGWDVAAIQAAGGHKVTFEDTRNKGKFPGYSRFNVPWGGFMYPAFDLNQRFEKADVLVSLSKLKQHTRAGVTMTVKNMFGATPSSLYGNDAPGENALTHRTKMFHSGRTQPPAGVPQELDHGAERRSESRVPRITADIYGARPVDLTVIDGIRTISGGEGYWNKGVALQEPKVLLAGRNVSATHAALGSVRVMGTTSLMGQAAGAAAAVALGTGVPLPEVPEQAIRKVQQLLLRDGCFLPNVHNEDARDLARSAKVVAGSQAILSACEPGDSRVDGGLGGGLPPTPEREILTYRRGQPIALEAGKLDDVAVCLGNETGESQTVEAKIVGIDHVWDYRCETAPVLAAGKLIVPPGPAQWIDWPVALSGESRAYVRLDLLANSNVRWHCAGCVAPGHIAVARVGPDRMRKFLDGETMSLRVSPPQRCYGPENAIRGAARPHRFTNLWRSDPGEPLPQWLELHFATAEKVACVELTFPGHLLRDYAHYPPLYREPQCARDYSLSAWVHGAWRELARESGNHQRHRRHRFEPVRTDRIRLTVKATNGDPAAAVCEVRCYAD